jgi:hypothetical protein
MSRIVRHAPAAIVALAAIGMVLYGPIHQAAAYHAFADTRGLMGVPNAWDVLSNAGFALVGIWGLWQFREAAARESLGGAWPGYALFLASLIGTAMGSAYYHLAPDDARLIWDRVPIALACAGLLAGVHAEMHRDQRGLQVTAALAVLACASVAWWWHTEDLRPYLLLQGAPLVLIPLWMVQAGSSTRDRLAFDLAIVLYVAAKVAELNDHGIFERLGLLSGHTIKHLLAIGAAAAIAATLAVRAREAVAAARAKPRPGLSLWDLERLGGWGGP